MRKTVVLTDEQIDKIVADAYELSYEISGRVHGVSRSFVGRLVKAYEAKQNNPDMTIDQFLDIARTHGKVKPHCIFDRAKRRADKREQKAREKARMAQAQMQTPAPMEEDNASVI